jgi:hypothetical protein
MQQTQQIRNTRAIAATSEPVQYEHRVGVLFARIGSDHMLNRTSVPYRVRGGVLRPGVAVKLTVQDLALAPTEALNVLKWVCNHPACDGKHWASQEELVADHPSDYELAARAKNLPPGQAPLVHLCFAVAEVAYVPGKPATGDAVATAPAGFICLYSDEG